MIALQKDETKIWLYVYIMIDWLIDWLIDSVVLHQTREYFTQIECHTWCDAGDQFAV